MGSSAISDYSWIEDVGGGSDGEFRWSLDGLGDLAPTSGLEIVGQYEDATCLEHSGSRKRERNEPCMGTKSKACREKMRRDRLNDRFLELSSVLDPGRPLRSDKASILSDAAHALVQLKSEAQQLKEANEKLQDTIKDLKAEKNELRDEKMKLKADRERLEQQVRAMSLPPPMGFMPHPAALHHHLAAAANFAAHSQASMKKIAPYPVYPGLAMWQPVDITQDPKAVPPNA